MQIRTYKERGSWRWTLVGAGDRALEQGDAHPTRPSAQKAGEARIAEIRSARAAANRESKRKANRVRH